jgi:hypothetical protein
VIELSSQSEHVAAHLSQVIVVRFSKKLLGHPVSQVLLGVR